MTVAVRAADASTADRRDETGLPAAYLQLLRRFRRIAHLGSAQEMLIWDQETMMPEGASAWRGSTLATVSGLAHEMTTASEVGGWLDEAEASAAGLDDWHRANLREMRRRWLHATAVPGELVERNEEVSSACLMAWRAARRADDFALAREPLARVLEVKRAIAAAKGEALGLTPYDALLEEYEPGGRAEAIDRHFDVLAAALPALVDEVVAHQERQGEPAPLDGAFPVASQEALGRRLMGLLGFDFSRGRLDVSLHPFCGGTVDDVRITTRYEVTGFAQAIMGVLHETGHALYEQGRPRGWLDQPVGLARGMSVHESQSLLIEMQACRSRAFVGHLAPLLREAFGVEGAAWEEDNLYRHYTRVRRGLVRVDADEVTYPAHVILRYRLERAMLAGDLTIDDLPGAFADGLDELLGVRPPGAALGALQDIHWYGGGWGYFPTYTLGAMTAAQLFAAAERAMPDLAGSIGRGEFGPLTGWLGREIHSRGSLLETSALIEAATGAPLDPQVFLAHLRRRYLGAG